MKSHLKVRRMGNTRWEIRIGKNGNIEKNQWEGKTDMDCHHEKWEKTRVRRYLVYMIDSYTDNGWVSSVRRLSSDDPYISQLVPIGFICFEPTYSHAGFTAGHLGT